MAFPLLLQSYCCSFMMHVLCPCSYFAWHYLEKQRNVCAETRMGAPNAIGRMGAIRVRFAWRPVLALHALCSWGGCRSRDRCRSGWRGRKRAATHSSELCYCRKLPFTTCRIKASGQTNLLVSRIDREHLETAALVHTSATT